MKKIITHSTLPLLALCIAACNDTPAQTSLAAEQTTDTSASIVISEANDKARAVNTSEWLERVLETQSDESKARFDARHPKETLDFFGIQPRMKIAEVLPGGGWYSKIILPYIGDQGSLSGIDYSLDMWSKFGGFANAEFLENKKTWPSEWTENAQEWRGGSKAKIDAYTFSTIPDSQSGQLDAVLFIRAMHNLHRFENDGGFLTQAMESTYKTLKPGGIVGIVQHRAPEGHSDEWANGSNGYLKQSRVIDIMKQAGFEFVGASEINANPKDKPSEEDFVWRLPPSLGSSADNPELRTQMQAIGESDRMTLRFKKPA